jgi:hypothetical protein
MKIVADINNKFNHVKYYGRALTYLQNINEEFLKRYPNLEELSLVLEISELGSFNTIQSTSAHQLNADGTRLEIRVDFIGYRINEKPDTHEFFRKLKSTIEIALM